MTRSMLAPNKNSEGKKVRIFRSIKELSQYSKKIHKIFQNDLNESAEESESWDNK